MKLSSNAHARRLGLSAALAYAIAGAAVGAWTHDLDLRYGVCAQAAQGGSVGGSILWPIAIPINLTATSMWGWGRWPLAPDGKCWALKPPRQ